MFVSIRADKYIAYIYLYNGIVYTVYTSELYAAMWMNYVSIMLKKEASYKIMQPDQN